MSSFNNIKFNSKDRISYVGAEFKSKSKLTFGFNSGATFLLGKSKLYAVATKENIIKPITLQGRFGGSFNNTRFNRGETTKYAGITLKNNSSFKFFDNNASISFKNNSNFTANPKRIRYPNLNSSIQPKFNRIGFNNNSEFYKGFRGISMISTKPHVGFSAGIIFKSESNLCATAYKFTYGYIQFNSISLIDLINFRARQVGLKLQGKSKFNATAYLSSQESLVLEGLGFKPTDVIIIDLDNYFVTHDGADITYKMSGVFFKFYPNVNKVYWQDNVNERIVKKEIVYQNKFL